MMMDYDVDGGGGGGDVASRGSIASSVSVSPFSSVPSYSTAVVFRVAKKKKKNVSLSACSRALHAITLHVRQHA